jgi:hypothetical protein
LLHDEQRILEAPGKPVDQIGSTSDLGTIRADRRRDRAPLVFGGFIAVPASRIRTSA